MFDALENLTKEQVLEIIDDFPVKPRANRVIITVNTFEEEGGLDMGMGMDEQQYVIAAGPTVRDLNPGDKVLLDLQKMMKMVEVEGSLERVPRIEIRPVKAYDRFFAMIYDNYIEAVDERV